ncbi:uncharacterized protein [Chironomus tepperi]|uniref:uncharacterized protein n=1 Tax=Chironomus tepperi TaxID=113505 RepID=UPI00391F5F15
MGKLIYLTACLIIIALSDSSLSVNIDCEFVLNDYIVYGSTYYCNVWTIPELQDAAQITSAKGIHKGTRSNDDVIGFHAKRKTMKFFPQNLLKVFKNLQRININGCKLEEVHQSDLKAHPNLTHFYLTENLIEVVEEGLFDYNPNLIWVGINEAKLIHIDAHVFDHLTGLKSFWFTNVPCIKKTIDGSREKVEAAIYIAKAYCVNNEFTALDMKLDMLESDAKSLNADDFKASLESFEKSFITSKFSKFRPLNYKFEKLKGSSSAVGTSGVGTNSVGTNSVGTNAVGTNAVGTNSVGTSSAMVGQNCPKAPENPQTPNSSVPTGLSNITDILKSSHDSVIQSLTKLTTKFTEHKLNTELSSDDIKSAISDMDTALSSIKASQNDLKTSINKLKNSQNEMAVTINELKGSKSEDLFEVDIKEQIETFMTNFTYFEVENAEKFVKMEKEFINTRHKLELSLDEKIKGIEKRILRKIEEILDEKLGKIMDCKGGKV